MKLMELYQDKIMGAIRGLDRIRFRGTLRLLANQSGLGKFMSFTNILLKDFGGWAEGLTSMMRQSCTSRAEQLRIEMRYLRSSGVDKEKLARQIAKEKGISDGSICMFSVVEPCIAPMIKGNKAQKKLELVMAQRKCVFVYHYFDDPVFGFGHVRIQSWLPFNIFICLNGRHWLERQLQKRGIGYIKDGNCFPWIEDIEAAQAIMDKQLRTDWAKMLNHLAFDSCPASWQKMRKGVSDLYRRCQVSDKCNERYADALASCQVEEKLKEVVSPACNKIKKKGKTYRGLNPWQEEDYKLLTFLAKGEHAIGGFRNRDLRKWLYPESDKLEKEEQKRYSGRTTRRIKLLRVHGLIKKVAKENRYMLTAKGQKFACALMTASAVDIKGLTKLAA